MPAILLVDDDPLFHYLVQRYAQRSGCEFVGAQSSSQAFAFALEHKPAMILLDLVLPPEDGWSILKKLKADGETQGIPVVICASALDQTRAVDEGADYCLPKPLMYDDFIHMLRDIGIPVAA